MTLNQWLPRPWCCQAFHRFMINELPRYKYI